MKKLLTLLLAVLLLAGCAGNKSGTFEAGKNTFLLNGKPFVVKAAEVHYPRIPREYWEHRIEMCKALGMNTLCPPDRPPQASPLPVHFAPLRKHP